MVIKNNINNADVYDDDDDDVVNDEDDINDDL
jgi:hypothetical protein